MAKKKRTQRKEPELIQKPQQLPQQQEEEVVAEEVLEQAEECEEIDDDPTEDLPIESAIEVAPEAKIRHILTTESIKDVDQMGQPIEPEQQPLIIIPKVEQPDKKEKVSIPQSDKIHCSLLSSCSRKVYKKRGGGDSHTVEMSLPDGRIYVVEFVRGESMIPQNVAEYIQKNLSNAFMVI